MFLSHIKIQRQSRAGPRGSAPQNSQHLSSSLFHQRKHRANIRTHHGGNQSPTEHICTSGSKAEEEKKLGKGRHVLPVFKGNSRELPCGGVR